ncbi:A24 family peptidase [Nocardia sp. NBC_00416]|uniref:A24 family peptidase n=1 Tax=Nocardia sp. NBC_00416 TaxID=2975991 RepID=UPI002E2476D7
MTTTVFLAFAAWCGVLSISDLRTRRLPNSLTVPGAATVLGYAALTGQCAAAGRGAVLLAAPYLLVHLLRPAALGAGDVKLAVGLGAAAGLGGGQVWVWSAFAAPLCTAAAGLGVLIGHRAGSRRYGGEPLLGRRAGPRPARAPDDRAAAVPHGPSMCAATLLGLTLW